MITNPTPQRALRGHRPHRLTDRAALTGKHHAHLAAHLTPRDRWLARVLHEHRVLTSTQITQLAFPSARAANHRLLQLYRWRVLDRFQPFLTLGSAPMHYVLDTAGAAVLAAEDDLDTTTVRYRHDRALGIAHSLRLAHTVGVNGFFTALVATARNSRDGVERAVTAWWSEARCARHFGDLVRPDGYGRWRGKRAPATPARWSSSSSTTSAPKPWHGWPASSPATNASPQPAASPHPCSSGYPAPPAKPPPAQHCAPP
jgi:Replication-relaxation